MIIAPCYINTLFYAITPYFTEQNILELKLFIIYLLPVSFFILFSCSFSPLIKAAKKQKALAFALGSIVQMVVPDPYVERTIKIVIEQKQTKRDQAQAKEREGKSP